MYREISNKLEKWKESNNRKPLILWGARQVGKTYSLKKFASENYENTIYISFYNNQRIANFFEQNYDVTRIITSLEIEYSTNINPKNTLIIFDEVQGAPKVVESLKYFCEEAPQYHIVCAGSLLGVALHEGVSFPVGKVDELHLYPLNFVEFLRALENQKLAEIIENNDIQNLNNHSEKYKELLKLYFAIGGMPAAVYSYSQNVSLEKVREIQRSILSQYEGDFGKHIAANQLPRTRMIWQTLPAQLAKENKKFFYGQIKKGARAKEFELALQWLVDSGLCYKIFRVNKPQAPINAYINPSHFKVFMLDVGLLSALAEMDIFAIAYRFDEMIEFKGAIAEQFVAQEFKANNLQELFYFSTEKGTFEVDFVFSEKTNVIPVEVKSGTNVASKSLHYYCDKYNPAYAIRFSLKGYNTGSVIKSIPLWAIKTLLIKEL